MMLRKTLLYTAISRAKQRFLLVGETAAVHIAVGRADAVSRNTSLAERLA